MINPFFQRQRNIYIYALAWVLIMLLHAALVIFLYNLNPLVALADSIIYNGLFALVGIILWYPVRYNNPEGRINLYTLLSYVILAIVILPLWLFLGYFLLRVIFPENETYFEFLNDSFVVRVISGVLYFSAMLLLYHLFVYSRALQQKELNEARLNLLVRESELNVLRSQMNPHFLFNSLNSISSLTITQPELAREMIIKLSDFLRYALKYGQGERTTFAEELKNIELYLDIEKIRFGEKLVFEKDIHDVCLGASVPNMILQPLVENAIKHGVYESTETVTINLSCSGTPDALDIRLSNNFDPEHKSRSGAGLGLKNVKNRLMLIYNKEGLMKVNKKENIFEIILIIPQTK